MFDGNNKSNLYSGNSRIPTFRNLGKHRRAILFLILLSFLIYTIIVITSINHGVENELINVTSVVCKETTRKINIQTSKALPSLQLDHVRFDNGRTLRIFDRVWITDKWSDLIAKFDVCLATQGSIERLGWISDVASSWRGPISVGVYLTSPKDWLVFKAFIDYSNKCDAMLRDTISFSAAVPSDVKSLDSQDKKMEILYKSLSPSCDITSKEYILKLKNLFRIKSTKDKKKIEYPQNHMRNIARKGCPTDWVLLTDIDLIPRPDAASSFQEFYESEEAKKCERCAFVVPVFELDASEGYPKSKKELYQLSQKGKARTFHSKVFEAGHKPTNQRKWISTKPQEEGPIKIAYSVNTTNSLYYEPFYISSDKIPPFDERFIGYGFTRSSQFQSALYEGWKFKVLTPTFLIHWGLQVNSKLVGPGENIGNQVRSLRQKQTATNSKIFLTLMEELKYAKKLRVKNKQRSTKKSK